MRLARRSLGQQYPGQGVQSASCGQDPCDFWDYLWVSDECSAWLQCAGQPPVTFSSVLGSGAASITSGAATVAGAGISGALSSPTTDIVLALLAVAAVGIWIVLDKL